MTSKDSACGGRGSGWAAILAGVLMLGVLLGLTAFPTPVGAQPASVRLLTAAELVPPPEPAVKPILPSVREIDRNGNKVDDTIDGEIAAAQAVPDAETRDTALREMIRVELVFSQQITQEQLNAFVTAGGRIKHIFKSVSYGWTGWMPRSQAPAVAAAMGAPLLAIVGDVPCQLHLKEATQNGRVRPVWVSGFAGSASGFDGDSNITIGVIDSGIDDSHTDLSGRQEYWADWTSDAEPTPRDIIQHGTHVAGIACGTGAAAGASPTTVLYTDSGNLTGVASGNFLLSSRHIPAGPAVLNTTAYWNDGGTGMLYGVYSADGALTYYALSAASSGASPLTENNSFTASSTNHYQPALLANGTITLYAITATATFSGAGDGFNALRGVAPACKWAGFKVFTNAGTGSGTDIGEGMDDVVTQRVTHNIKVCNMSIGVIGAPGISTTQRAKVNTMAANGIVPVCSAGNDGPGTALANQIDDPGRAAYALTVAASNTQNELTRYTSSGFASPGSDEDYKPDVMAPGGSDYYTNILAPDSNDADAGSTSFADKQADDYLNIKGTSMAAPFAAGCAALVIDALQQSGVTWDFNSSTHPFLVKMLLCMTATESNANREAGTGTNPTLGRGAAPKDLYEGYGMINPDAAIEAVMQTFASGTWTNSTAGGYSDRRCWARKISMQTNKVVRVSLTVPSTADLDLYLYSGTPDSKGNPQILAYSCSAGLDTDESIEYLADSNATGYLVVKRVSGSGSWSLDGTVTGVELASLTAAQNAGAVRLDWRTGFEADNLGFNIYRETNGVLTRLTPELIAGSALLAGAGTPLTAGAAYSWWDTLPLGSSEVRYWLEDVDLNGTVKRHGPVRPAPSVEPLSPAAAAALLAQVGRDSARASVRAAAILPDRASVAAHIAPVVQTLEPIVCPPATTCPVSLRETQWRLAAGRTAKITVRQEGWYRLGKRQLTALGFDPALNPRLLQLFCNGLEIPIAVAGEQDGRFDDNDTLEFYGWGADTLWSDAQTYWLTLGSQPGRRIPTVPNVAPTAAPLQHFPYTVERKDRTVYFAALKNGDASNFFGPTIAGQPVAQVLAVAGLARVRTSAKLEVALQGVTLGAHRVAVQLNGAPVGTIAFSGQMHGAARFAVPQSALREGDNVVTLVSTGGTTDVSLVDAVRLTYARLYQAENNSLRMTAPAGKPVVVGGFTHSRIRVMDVTHPSGAVEIRGVVRPDPSQAGRYSVEIVAPGMGRRTLLAFAPSAVKVPAALSPNVPSSWHAAGRRADMVIITPARFRAAVHPLQWLRRSQGLSVVVIDVADLYDEFNFGNKSAYALRDFLARARALWAQPPRFVLLAGDASADPRDYYGLGDRDFVPTKLVDTAVMETASDDWFADFNGDHVPEMGVGRLPVRSIEETAAAVAKILAYEQSPAADWTRRALLVADNNDTFDFEAASAEVGALLPDALTVDGVFLGWTTLDLARAMLLEKLNSGRLLVNYIGHGSMDMWAGEGLLTSRDAAALTNGEKLPLVVSMTCLNGYLQDPRNDCLAKALMNARQGGAIAVWASSGMTGPSAQAELNKAFVRALFGPHNLTVGQAAMRAKQAVTLPDLRRTWILFGDPAMRLK